MGQIHCSAVKEIDDSFVKAHCLQCDDFECCEVLEKQKFTSAFRDGEWEDEPCLLKGFFCEDCEHGYCGFFKGGTLEDVMEDMFPDGTDDGFSPIDEFDK